ncbi:MAG TPA: 2-phospho-L-lactate transferase [Aggregatilineales bacterium]|nr:2-phospho-L-lactate transferase [Aggregatilineales bacterium]
MALGTVPDARIVALAGGVGGAKLAYGLARCLPPDGLTVIVNTGDDFRRYGLAISPDLDTVMYTLAELADPTQGWGLAGDTRQMVDMLRRYGDDPWFGLGDRDIATHLLRTQALSEGNSLSQVTAKLASALGVTSHLVPMTDDCVQTMVETVEHGLLAFQEYFVRYRWQPVVTRLSYDGAASSQPAPGVLEALQRATAVVICPSNPLLSVEPILQVAGIRDALASRNAPSVAVSPIIGGQAVKGPAAKLMAELALDASAEGVARYYGDLIDGLVVDHADQEARVPQKMMVTNSLMQTSEDRTRLAGEILGWVKSLTV